MFLICRFLFAVFAQRFDKVDVGHACLLLYSHCFADGFSVFRKESGILKDSEMVVYRNGKREVWEVGESFARPTKVFEKGILVCVCW